MVEGANDLARLIEVEQQLDREQVAGAAEAEQLRTLARQEAATLEQRLAADVAAGTERLGAELRAARRDRLAAIEADARREAGVFAAVSDERVRAFARTVVARLVAAEDEAS